MKKPMETKRIKISDAPKGVSVEGGGIFSVGRVLNPDAENEPRELEEPYLIVDASWEPDDQTEGVEK